MSEFLPQLRPLATAENKEALRNIYREFSIEDATRVKEIESVTNHDVKAVEYFLKEKTVNFIFDDFQKLDTIVMGIGATSTSTDSTLIQGGYITSDETKALIENGVAGNVALQFFDKEGNTEKFQAFNERVAGMPQDMMKRVRNRIGIGGGADRADAIKGAIKGGFINILITNNACAEKLL